MMLSKQDKPLVSSATRVSHLWIRDRFSHLKSDTIKLPKILYLGSEKINLFIAFYGLNRLQYFGCTSLFLVDKLFLYKTCNFICKENKPTLSGCPPSKNKGSFRLEYFSKAAMISGARGGTPGARGGDFPFSYHSTISNIDHLLKIASLL